MKTKWLSPQIEEIRGRKVFCACRIVSGECVSTGDYVHLLPSKVPCSKSDLYIARIESMYEDADNAMKWIQVRWFYRPNDLQHDPPLQPLQNEVYHTQYYDSQLVESIVGRCNIMWREDYLRVRTRINAGVHTNIINQDILYACGYSYSITSADSSVMINGNFTTIQEEDLAGHVAGLPYLDMHDIEDGKHGDCISHEGIVITKYLANRLLKVERNVPIEVTRADWSLAKRLPWVLKAKNAMTLEDLKQLLIEVGNGLQVFKDQIKWQKRVDSITSFSLFNNHLRYLKQNIQRKVDNAFLKPTKMNPPPSHKESHEQIMMRKKRKDFATESNTTEKTSLKRKATEDPVIKISAGNAYEIEHKHLPPSAPRGLRLLRVAMVSKSSKDKVTITYPRMSSSNIKHFQHLQYNSLTPDNKSAEKKRSGYTIYNNLVRRSRPSAIHLDGCFVMLPNVAEKVLKRQISRSEYLDRHHLETFWLMCPNVDHCRKDNENQFKCSIDGNVTKCLLKKPSLAHPESLQKDEMQVSPEYQNATIITYSETGTASPQLFRRKLKKSSTMIDHNYKHNYSPNEDGYRLPTRWGTRKRIVYQSPQANVNSSKDFGYRQHTYSEECDIDQTNQSRLRDNSPIIPLDNEGNERPTSRTSLDEAAKKSREYTGLVSNQLPFKLQVSEATQITLAVEEDKVICHRLKEDFMNLKSQMQSLARQIKGSHDTNSEFSPTFKTFKENITKQSEEMIKKLLEIKERLRSRWTTENLTARMHSFIHCYKFIIHGQYRMGTGKDADYIETQRKDMVCTSDHLLKSIVQLVEDASYGYVKFSNEKTMTKEQLDELWRTNEKLQKELSAILNTLELCQHMHVGCMKSSELLFEGKRQESAVSQKYCKTDTITTKAENVLLFQFASGLNISPTRNDPLANSAYSSSMAINSAISPLFAGNNRTSAIKESQSTGFRVWKPEHSNAKIKLAP